MILVFFFLMLIFPHEVFRGASEGLLLWFQIVLPTLLPSMILANLLIHTNSLFYISHVFGPVFHYLFHISESGSFSVLTGFLCGYPMGAKVTADLVSTGHISKSEGNYLLSFCNNTSPMFLISYVVLQNLKKPALMLPSVCIVCSAPVLCSFLFRMYYKPSAKPSFPHKMSLPSKKQFEFQVLDACIMNGFETITKVGGYIMLFSILFALFEHTPFKFLLPLLEITNGIPLILKNIPSFPVAYVYLMTLTAFGGLCSVAQTKSMIQGSGLSIRYYVIEKLITALVTSLLAFLYMYFSILQ